MSTLLVVRDIVHGFGGPPVLNGAAMRVDRGDRVCIVGRNGEGKSTLLRIIRGELKPDSGFIDLASGASMAYLDQIVPEVMEGTVFEVVTAGLGAASKAIAAFHNAAALVGEDPSQANLDVLEKAQSAVDIAQGWDVQHRVDAIITKLELDAEQLFASLSGGWRRRVFLARALVNDPDVLILDEPTNHLDIEAVEWLENLLLGFGGAIIFITHDRAFLRHVATKIVDLDRGKLTAYPGDYDVYLERKDHDLEVEATHDALFDKKLAQEEAWIRTGIKARRTRNEGRVRALKAMRSERRDRRKRGGQAVFSVQTAAGSGSIVFELENASFAYDTEPLVKDLSMIVRRGTRIGMIGPNGAGKTTLIRLMLGELEPTSGEVIEGTRLEVRYFDQLRNQLDPNATVADTVAPDGDQVVVNGKAIHIQGYLRKFLFDDSQARSPVSVLSGGERGRLLLAKLFSEPANVLVLDEPTNDLDIETLELLEGLLCEFDGTVLLVSHDREFLDNVVTESLIFRGEGDILRVAGGYSEWDVIRAAERADADAARKRALAGAVEKRHAPRKKKALTYAQTSELQELPDRIEKLESEQVALHKEIADPSIYRDAPDRVKVIQARLEAIETLTLAAMERWEELESLKGDA